MNKEHLVNAIYGSAVNLEDELNAAVRALQDAHSSLSDLLHIITTAAVSEPEPNEVGLESVNVLLKDDSV